MLNDPTRLFGVIGNPVGQVRSPERFNDVFRRCGLNAVMISLWIEARLATMLEALLAVRNLEGLVITVPYKAAAAACAVSLSRRARLAGVANALRRAPGGWEADLFDGEGFIGGALGHGVIISGARCAIVGAGGAGSAISLALLEGGAASLDVFDINREKCESLLRRLKGVAKVPIRAGRPGPDHDLVVNATPLGMSNADLLPFDLEAISQKAWVAEVVMAPATTRLLAKAAARGNPVLAGIHMLDGQLAHLLDYFGLPACLQQLRDHRHAHSARDGGRRRGAVRPSGWRLAACPIRQSG